jgi:AbrB family looped-hinge helix DNA binding protein
MRLTSKGQVTIPQELREEAGMRPGDDLEFALDGDGLRVTKKQDGMTRGERQVARLKEHARHFTWAEPRMTTDEIMALMRGE